MALKHYVKVSSVKFPLYSFKFIEMFANERGGRVDGHVEHYVRFV
jgi:hypothetical protein